MRKPLQIACVLGFLACCSCVSQVSDIVWEGRPPWGASHADMLLLQGITDLASRFDKWHHDGFALSALTTLSPGQYINDLIVNARIKQLNKAHSTWKHAGLDVPAVLCMPTHFMKFLMAHQGFDYHAAAMFTDQEALLDWCSHWDTILDCDLLLVPCFVKGASETAVGHWFIMVADLNRQEIVTYDPLMVSGLKVQAYFVLVCYADVVALHCVVQKWVDAHAIYSCVLRSDSCVLG